jgi:hypothetical protein
MDAAEVLVEISTEAQKSSTRNCVVLPPEKFYATYRFQFCLRQGGEFYLCISGNSLPFPPWLLLC